MNRIVMFENGNAIVGLQEMLQPYSEKLRMQVPGTDSKSVAEPHYGYGVVCHIMAMMEKHLLDDHFFVRPDCSLEVLCRRMSTNRTYISSLVGTVLGMNFRNMISALRVEYAKSLLMEHPSMPIEQVALSSGFRYATQLDRKFHKLVGMTPGEWKLSVQAMKRK